MDERGNLMDYLKDMLLFPRKFYGRLTGRKSTLIAGALLVGAVDLLFPLALENWKEVFFNGSSLRLQNVLITVILIILTGLVDVAFFGIPMADLFKVFKKEKEPALKGNMRTVVMKIYVVAHVFMIPAQIIIYYILKNLNIDNLNYLVVYGYTLLTLVPVIWFNAAITRGVNTVYQFDPLFKRLVFPLVFLWTFLTSEALNYAINNWILKLIGIQG